MSSGCFRTKRLGTNILESFLGRLKQASGAFTARLDRSGLRLARRLQYRTGDALDIPVGVPGADGSAPEDAAIET